MSLRLVHPPVNTLLDWDLGQRVGTWLRKLDVGYRPPPLGFLLPRKPEDQEREEPFPIFPWKQKDSAAHRRAIQVTLPKLPWEGPVSGLTASQGAPQLPSTTHRDRLGPPAGAVFQPSLLAMCEVQIRLISSVRYQGQIFQMFAKTSFLSTGCLCSTSRHNTKT